MPPGTADRDRGDGDAALRRLDGLPEVDRRVEWFLAKAGLEMDSGNLTAARGHLHRAVNEATQGGAEAADAWFGLAMAEWTSGDFHTARDYFGMAQRAYRAANDRRGEAASLRQLAVISLDEGDVSTAARRLADALAGSSRRRATAGGRRPSFAASPRLLGGWGLPQGPAEAGPVAGTRRLMRQPPR